MLPAQNESGSPVATISSSLSALKKVLLTNLFFSFFINLALFATPLYMMQVYNRVLPSQSQSTLVMLTGWSASLWQRSQRSRRCALR